MADAAHDDLHELRQLFAHDAAEWKPIRDEGAIDMRYAAGDPWEPRDRADRLKVNRPCINADELSQYVNQVVNEVRANKRAVKFTPTGNGATDASAAFYANKMREIEYRSRAQIGYTTAFQDCVTRSFGFVRVNTRYIHSRAVNQDLWIDPVPNPNLITPDTSALMPDLSDMQHCWVRESWDMGEFNRKWDTNKITRFTSDLSKDSSGWVTEHRVFVGEKWEIQTTKRTLLIFEGPDGETVGFFEDELKDKPSPGRLLRERKVDDPKVVMTLTNGLDILEETQWPGKYIPIIGCLGKILYVSESGLEKRQILSMIRLARDPQMAYAYLWTNEVEVVGAMPRFPYFVRKGSLDAKNLANLADSTHKPIAVVEVEAFIEGTPPGTPVEFPQRNPYEPPLQALEISKEAARRAIQAAMGQTPLPTAAQRRNEKSGVALKHMDDLGQRGSYHFTDHYLDMLTHVGIVCEDLMDKIYDSARDVGIRKDDDTAEIVRINDPRREGSISTKGDHLVTVSTGPSFESERDAAQDFATNISSQPQMLQLMGPQKSMQVLAKSIKLLNLGPIGDQICEILDPQPEKDGQPSPQQLQAMVQQAQGQLQALQQQLAEAAKIIQTKQVEGDYDLKKATIDQETRIEVAKIQMGSAIQVADIKAQVDRAELALEQMRTVIEAAEETRRQREAHAHDAGMAALEHEHTLREASHASGMAVASAEQSHGQAMEAGEAGHAYALEANQQAADLAPQPEASA